VSYASTALGHMRIDELLDDARQLDARAGPLRMAVAPGAKQGPYGPHGPASTPGEGEARAAGPAPGQHYVCAVPRAVLRRHVARTSESCGELKFGDIVEVLEVRVGLYSTVTSQYRSTITLYQVSYQIQ
jgi:hypothetical protein